MLGRDNDGVEITAAMQRAIELAQQSSDPSPNPRVGCVLLSPTGEVVGEGWHEGPGQPHAEVVALTNAGQQAAGATAVVTLEPCSHIGRTGPCAQALIDANIARVIYAQTDPNPEAADGASRLREAGIQAEGGIMAAEAHELNRAWSFAMEYGRPWVRWKTAATLDGRVAAVDGSSQWITSEEARQDVHQLRAEADAVMVGTGTLFSDDPELTCRLSEVQRQPLRVVVGQRAVPAQARVRLAEPMSAFVHVPNRQPEYALADLLRRGVHSVLLEGGPTLARAFLKAGLVDWITWYTAPLLLGAGREVVPSLGIASLNSALRFNVSQVRQVGDDVRIDMEPDKNPDGS